MLRPSTDELEGLQLGQGGFTTVLPFARERDAPFVIRARYS